MEKGGEVEKWDPPFNLWGTDIFLLENSSCSRQSRSQAPTNQKARSNSGIQKSREEVWDALTNSKAHIKGARPAFCGRHIIPC